MIFRFEDHCAPAAYFSYTGAKTRLAGTPGTLTVLLVERGCCTVSPAAGDGNAPEAGEGWLVLAPAPVNMAPQGPCEVRGASLAGAAPRELAAALDGPQAVSPEDCPGAAELMQRLCEGAALSAPAEQSAMAYALVCRLATAGQARELPPLVSAAMGEIREHFAEVYGVEELAAELGVSKSHLIRSFTAATGLSPGRFLTTVRVENAKRLLAQGTLSLDMVASLCGFSGANYLCKVFRKETGETPAAWRRRAAPGATHQPASEWEEQMYL